MYMNTRKINVKLVDRPATLLCSIFTKLLGKRRVDRNGKDVWGFMIRYTDKVYAMVRKNIIYLTNGLYRFSLDVSSRTDISNDRLLT